MDNLKSVFIAVPKTGLTSMLKAFDNHKDVILTEHCPLYQNIYKDDRMYNFNISISQFIKQGLGEERWNSLFTFAFVRNPWDRYVSNWNWLTRREDTYPSKGWKSRGWDGEDGTISFRDFVMQMEKVYTMNTQGYQHDRWHLWNQKDHIVDLNGNIIVDYIAKYENINEEFKYICNKNGIPELELPHLNYVGYYEGKPKPEKKHYSLHYDDELVEIVRQRCSSDIDCFGYEYEERK